MDWTEIVLGILTLAGVIGGALITNRTTKKEVKKSQEVTKELVDGVRAEIRESDAKQIEALTDMMRNDITALYYKRQDVKKLYQYERESLDKMYKGYHEAGGNTFIDDIYTEMRTWHVVGAGDRIKD